MTFDTRGQAVESASTDQKNVQPQQNQGTVETAETSNGPDQNPNEEQSQQQSPPETDETIDLVELVEKFPEDKLRSLIAKISSPRWVVPVLPEQELEILLNYSVELAKAGIDQNCELCVRFYRESLTVSFMKILTDEAVNMWKFHIHFCILNTCGLFMQLIANHLKHGTNPYLLDLLAVVLDPDNKFNTFNLSRSADQYTICPPIDDNDCSTIPPIVVTSAKASPTSTVSTSSSQTSSLSTSLSTATTGSSIGPTKPQPQIPINNNNEQRASTVTVTPKTSNESDIGNVSTPRPSTVTPGNWGILYENNLFAKSPNEPHSPRGWLVDLINRFGQFNGFDHMIERFDEAVNAFKTTQLELQTLISDDAKDSTIDKKQLIDAARKLATERSNITLHLIYGLVRPFGQCYELLTIETIEKYFLPMWNIVLDMLNNLTDDELKRESKPEGRNDLINGIIKAARCLTSRLPNQEHLIKELEMFRLKMILRLLKISSFNGKMNALNEINKILFAVSCYPHRSSQIPLYPPDEELDWLSAEKIAKWIKDSDVLGIVLHDSLHQPQYVEKLEKILRFLIKEKALTISDLEAVWQAQVGKHEAIVKNVHDLLAKLAWDFNTEQLDYLFECFQASMKTANKRQRERLLELIRRLAEDDKSGVMAHKVLKQFWTLAHSHDIPKEVMEQALTAHVKILDYSCAQERDKQKSIWLTKCVEELKQDDQWVLPALRLIREICCLYEPTTNHVQRMHQNLNRQHVIERLQNEHTLVILVTNSLLSYMKKVHTLKTEHPETMPDNLCLDKRYPHQQQIQERLDFLKFVLKDGQLWLCSDQAKQIWQCLAVDAAFPSDREECFRWFGKLMGEEPDLDPGINREFFENNILELDPQYLTESGIRCFERFFKAVNSKAEKLKSKSRGYILDDEDLIGKDYLWRVITTGNEIISHKAIELLKEVSTALGPRLQANIAQFHENFIMECCDRLKANYDNIIVLNQTREESATSSVQTSQSQLSISNGEQACEDKDQKLRFVEAEKMWRVIIVLIEYVKECDRSYNGERICLPLCRSYRGKHMVLIIRFQCQGRQQLDDIEIVTHSNEMVVSFKRNLLKRIKGAAAANVKIDFYYNDNLIEMNDDRSPIGSYNIRDKMLLTAKLMPYGPGTSDSPDSSSDSSTGSPPRPCPDMMKPETEWQLPGIIISQKPQFNEFFLQLYQLGIELNHSRLRDGCRTLLHLLPADRLKTQKIQQMCNPLATFDTIIEKITPEMMFIEPSFAQTIYNLEVLYSLIVPAIELNQSFLMSYIHSGVAHFVLSLLTNSSFVPGSDVHTKRAAFHNVLRSSKVFLHIIGCVLCKVGDEPSAMTLPTSRSQIELLKTTFSTILGTTEQTIRSIALKLSDNLATEMLSGEPEGEACRALFASALKWSCPDLETIKSIIELAWSSGCGNMKALKWNETTERIEILMPDQHDHSLCRESLEVLTTSLVLNPQASTALADDPIWKKFILSLVLENPMRSIRQSSAEQLYLMSTYCASDHRPFAFLMELLLSALNTLAPLHANTCADYFQLLCRTLNYGCAYNWTFTVDNALMQQEIDWLRQILSNTKESGEPKVHEDLLEGHLCLTKELLFYFNSDVKNQLTDFIGELLNEFLFPASRQYLHLQLHGQLIDIDSSPPVCRNPHTIMAACELVAALSQNSIPNMNLIVNHLMNMVCTHSEPLREWEYLPPINVRPLGGFCGLKNAGATCYMNSVLQQLYMVPLIRFGILSAKGACTDPNEDFSNEIDLPNQFYKGDQMIGDKTNVRNQYHVGILKHVQAIFAHLGHSSLQYYVPRGLWSHFKLQGEPVNLREQQDAVEFFMSILDSLDEGLKALGQPQLMSGTLGGCFSDQKICQECPHRYSKEEPFSVFSVDIRNHSSLTESLEQYVKGELLEGADAYHCDKCNRKVVTVKRLCVRKLPPVLAIQLKRFEYDYERVCAIKFNDYFEFPRELDMEPYTVSGLAKVEGEVIEIDETFDEETATKYQLTGIVVHSGQASGGHYFSYILHKDQETGKEQWYKFDDGEVTECKMHEDDELKTQCFGGDYMGEVFDNNLKRMQFRRQKRWWNAYMLFYTRCDVKFTYEKSQKEQLSLAESRNFILPMPEPIERSVRIQNTRFLHLRSIFTMEFFNFIRKLMSSSAPPSRVDVLTPQMEELSMLGLQLGTQFLFHSGFRTKKVIRGAAMDWHDALCPHLRHSASVRHWFAENALLAPPNRLAEYILIATSPEIRTVFVKLIVIFCHFAINDEPIQDEQLPGHSLCEQILFCVLCLLKSEVPENGKHLAQYFSLFHAYANSGVQQKQQLLKLNVPAIFMQVALDEGPGPPIKHQYPDLCKLHHVVSQLLRCSDISSRCKSSNDGPILPNPYGDQNVSIENRIPLSKEAMDYLFNKPAYIKKLLEDVHVGEEGLKLLQYCSWENPQFSRTLLIELMWQCGFSYWHDMRHHTDMLLNILLMEDSWQNHRIHNALLGVAQEREGLLETIHRIKLHYQKRAYQIVKCLVQLFKRSPNAHEIMLKNAKAIEMWASACDWLRDELDRRGSGNQYSYQSWAQPFYENSNGNSSRLDMERSKTAMPQMTIDQLYENSNSCMLERSMSAKNILQLACELLPGEVDEPYQIDSSDCDELPDGVLARIQSQEMLDQAIICDVVPIEEDPATFNGVQSTDPNRISSRAFSYGPINKNRWRCPLNQSDSRLNPSDETERGSSTDDDINDDDDDECDNDDDLGNNTTAVIEEDDNHSIKTKMDQSNVSSADNSNTKNQHTDENDKNSMEKSNQINAVTTSTVTSTTNRVVQNSTNSESKEHDLPKIYSKMIIQDSNSTNAETNSPKKQ